MASRTYLGGNRVWGRLFVKQSIEEEEVVVVIVLKY